MSLAPPPTFPKVFGKRRNLALWLEWTPLPKALVSKRVNLKN